MHFTSQSAIPAAVATLFVLIVDAVFSLLSEIERRNTFSLENGQNDDVVLVSHNSNQSKSIKIKLF